MRRTSTILLSLLLVGLFSVTLNIQASEADWDWTQTIYIRADGSIEPEGTPISIIDNATYMFTENVSYNIVVERDNITIDGNGYFLQGPGQGGGIHYSMTLTGRCYVTVTNMKIIHGNIGISLQGSSNNTINGNSITNHVGGISLHGSSNNTISRNNLTGTSTSGAYGILLMDESVGNTISGNNAKNNPRGISIWFSSNNTIVQNNLSNNYIGILFFNSSNIRTYHNNFFSGSSTSYQVAINNSTNVWDDGYPSGGNYWSNYTGSDLYSGPHQNVSGSDGVGDTPYVIDEENQDNYPLMKPYPWSSHDIGIASIEGTKAMVGQGQTITVNSTIFNYGNHTENFNVTVHANGTVIGLFGNVTLESRNSITLNAFWDTTGFANGNYTINIYAAPVPGEMDISDNTVTGWAFVTFPGDVDRDRDVDMFDIVFIAGAYGSKEGDAEYIANCDIDGNDNVNIFDVVIAAGHYGESW